MLERIVIIGAAGDLMSRFLLPALAVLREDGKLPRGFAVDAVARHDLTSASYRREVEGPLARFAPGVPEASREALLRSVSYHRADASDAAALRSILSRGKRPAAVYLALPPGVFRPAVEALVEAGLGNGDRIVVEKPYGENLESTRSLNRLLHRCVPEDSVFRIDHFLGLQTVRNLLGIRFGNRIFEPLWNSGHVERVEIRFDETLALEGRAGYYDRTGALRDMLQNHLLQMLCLIAMEPPAGSDAGDLRDRKMELLRSVRRFPKEEAAAHSIRARYAAGAIDGKPVPSYLEERGVDPDRGTETFSQLTLFVDNRRWSGVPFVLRSGKALDRNRQEIVVRFRPAPYPMFSKVRPPEPNVLRLAFEPDRVALDLNLNGADDPFDLAPARLELEPEPQHLPAYGLLLLDVLRGDCTFSIRADEAEESWRIIDPVVEAWSEGLVPMREYPAGSAFEL